MNHIKNICLLLFLNQGFIASACLPRWILNASQKYAHPAFIEMNPKDEPAKKGEVRIFIEPEEFKEAESFTLVPFLEMQNGKKIVRVQTDNHTSYYDAESFAHFFGKKDDLQMIDSSIILGKFDVQKRTPIVSYALYKKIGTLLERQHEWPHKYNYASSILIVAAIAYAGNLTGVFLNRCLGY